MNNGEKLISIVIAKQKRWEGAEKQKRKIPQKQPQLDDPKGKGRREQLEEQFGAGVISLLEKEQFWFELIHDLKGVDGEAGSRMLGVIQDAAIGNHEVTEKKYLRTAPKELFKQPPSSSNSPPI